MPMEILSLTCGPMSLTSIPALGGCLADLSCHDEPIFRRASGNITDVVDAAYFPMLPICNRIRNAEFQFEGRYIRLSPNQPGVNDHVHGQGWQSAWEIDKWAEGVGVLHLDYPGGEWPWQYRAEQIFELGPRGLRIGLSITNTSDSEMPAGLGFHPFFPLEAQTRLQFCYDGYWHRSVDGYPDRWVGEGFDKDWHTACPVPGTVLTDHTFTGFAGDAVILRGAEPKVRVRADSHCGNLHVFIPPGDTFFCIEPASNRPDPFNERPQRLQVLQPGETFEISMDVNVV